MTEIRESALITSGIITFLVKNGWAHTYFVAKLGKIEVCGIITANDARNMSIRAYAQTGGWYGGTYSADNPVWVGRFAQPLRKGTLIHLPDPRTRSSNTTAPFTIARLFSTKEALAGEREIMEAAVHGTPSTVLIVPDGWQPRRGYLPRVRVRRSSGLRSP